MSAWRLALCILAGLLITAGSFAPSAISETKRSVPKPTVTLRGEAPHLEMSTDPLHGTIGQEITVKGVLRGYNLAGSDFCLKPRWIVFASNAAGDLVGIPFDSDPVQCRDHEFSRGFSFAFAGTYAVQLELRTTGTKVRLAEWKQKFVEVYE